MTDTGVARALARILPDQPGRARPAIVVGRVIGPGGDQSGPYSGSFRIVGQSVSFESSAAPYDFTCTGQAPGALKP